MKSKLVLQIAHRVLAVAGLLCAAAAVVDVGAQTSKEPSTSIMIYPQNDIFTFEIGRVVHNTLSKLVKSDFMLMTLERAENAVMYPGLSDGVGTYPGPLHGEAADPSMRRQLTFMMRVSAYFALIAEINDGHWYVDVRMLEPTSRAKERSLGWTRFTDTKGTGERIAKLIAADTAFRRVADEMQKRK